MQRPTPWLALIVLLAFGANGFGEPWPVWRGSNGDGLSRETEVPLRWSPSDHITWKTPIPGKGHSSPIVWDDSIFLLSARADRNERILLRIDRKTGRTVWERTVLRTDPEPIHRLNSYASSTPATDGKRVFVTFLDRSFMYVAAYDFDGNKLWEQRPGEFFSKHGFCSNPVLYRDRLIVNGDHDGDAYIVMLEQATGSILWKIGRENKTRSYCTPIIVPINGVDQLMLNGSLCTAGYDIRTGKQIWICDGPSEQMVATLVHGHGLIFSLGGYPERHLLAIKKGGTGDVTDSHILWRTHKGIPYVPSPLLYGDYLHVVSDEGVYTCFDPKSGQVHTKTRLSTHVSSSLVGACDRVYVTDDDGITIVLENGPRGRILSKNSVGENVYSSPAISGGEIYIRGEQHLFCISGTDVGGE